MAGDAQAGGYAVKQRLADTWPFFAELAHETIWLRSPEFKLNGGGDLTFWLMGGGVNPVNPPLPPASEAEVPLNSVDSNNGGWHGVVLRNVATGAFVLIGNRQLNGPPVGALWEKVTFTAAQLDALDQNAVYTLDLIDARNNSWSVVNMDSVAIPGTLVSGPPADAYAAWATTKGLAGAAAGFDADPDNDGLVNGIEFVLGGEPNPAHPDWVSSDLLPTAAQDEDFLIFTYTRTKASAYLNPVVEFDADLIAPWTTAVAGANANIQVTDNGTTHTVAVSIPKLGAAKLFVRLRVVQPSP